MCGKFIYFVMVKCVHSEGLKVSCAQTTKCEIFSPMLVGLCHVHFTCELQDVSRWRSHFNCGKPDPGNSSHWKYHWNIYFMCEPNQNCIIIPSSCQLSVLASKKWMIQHLYIDNTISWISVPVLSFLQFLFYFLCLSASVPPAFVSVWCVQNPHLVITMHVEY